MIVAHIVSHLNTGGAEKLVAELSNAMNNKGIKVKVITLFKGRGIPYKILNTDKVELIELNYDSKFNPKIALDLFKLTTECDIVHTHTYYAQFYSSIFIPKNKLITTEHSSHNNRRGKAPLKILDYLMYSKYSKIICISNATKESLNKWVTNTTNKSLIIHNGIELSKYINAIPISRDDLNIGEDKVVLVCVGRFEKAKNQESIIKAMKHIDTRALLLLVGSGNKEVELKELVNKLRINDRVIFLGQRKDVDNILKSSDIFILPSLWEGFGLAAIEAIASGLPALLSDVDGLKEVTANLDACVQYFNPNEINDIVIKTNQMVQSISLIKDKNRFVDLEKYSIENMIREYLEVYNVTIRGKK